MPQKKCHTGSKNAKIKSIQDGVYLTVGHPLPHCSPRFHTQMLSSSVGATRLPELTAETFISSYTPAPAPLLLILTVSRPILARCYLRKSGNLSCFEMCCYHTHRDSMQPDGASTKYPYQTVSSRNTNINYRGLLLGQMFPLKY